MPSPASARPSPTATATSASVSAGTSASLRSAAPSPASSSSRASSTKAPASRWRPMTRRPARSATPFELERIARRHDQALLPPRPLDQHHGLAGKRALDVLDVPCARAFPPFSGRCTPAICACPMRHLLEAGKGAAEADGEAGAGLAQRPIEQRVMAAGADLRPRLQRLRSAAILDVLGEPGLHQMAREQQLAGDPHARDRAGRDEVVDLALLEADEIGHLAGGEVVRHRLGHGLGIARSRRTG